MRLNTTIVALVTDVRRDGARIVGFGFSSIGRFGQRLWERRGSSTSSRRFAVIRSAFNCGLVYRTLSRGCFDGHWLKVELSCVVRHSEKDGIEHRYDHHGQHGGDDESGNDRYRHGDEEGIR